MSSKMKPGGYIGEWSLGAVGYADDVVLLVPSAGVIRRLIVMYWFFSKDYNVTFNCNKNICITFSGPDLSKDLRPVFVIDGNCIENVDECIYVTLWMIIVVIIMTIIIVIWIG